MTTASIHRVLMLWVMGALALGATLLAGGSYLALTREMGEVFEDNLKQVALAVANHHGTYGITGAPKLALQLPRIYKEYGKFEYVTAVWTLDGRRLHSSDDSVALPFLSRSGASKVRAGGARWHLYTIVLDDGIVQVAQRASERETLARESASELILPAVALLALIAVLLTLALQRGLEPLSRAAADVAARSAEALHPIPLASHPRELHPLVGAVNDLMGRLGSALSLQRHFLADAAHELRTPITALGLQLQLLERANDGPQRALALAELATGVSRARHLVEQLLQLSRLGPETPELVRRPVSLAALARTAVSHFSARAEQRRIDLGAVVTGEPIVLGDSQQLTILVNNLVDNALRHTPAGGRVDVAVGMHHSQPRLCVTDTGAGIAAADRERVFDRFFRAAPDPLSVDAGPGPAEGGSGLGLAIVKAVADRHGASMTLADAVGGGLAVSACFPPAKAP